MPAQLKQRSDNAAAAQQDLVYANSGLFSIETEIENFAGKYSSYNKCFQSQMFLKKVLEITADEIEQQKEECDGIRQSIKDKLEEDKAKLIEKLEQTAADERQEYDDTYGIHMSKYLEGIEGTFSAEDLSVRVEELTKNLEGEMGYDDRQDDVKKSFADVGENLKDKFNNAPKKFSIATLKSMATGFADDVSAVRDAYKAQKDTRHQIDKAAADQLLEIVTNDYIKRLESVHDLLDEKSQEYWTENTERLRKILAKVVTGSEVLTDERREELERIIITYQKLAFRLWFWFSLNRWFRFLWNFCRLWCFCFLWHLRNWSSFRCFCFRRFRKRLYRLKRRSSHAITCGSRFFLRRVLLLFFLWLRSAFCFFDIRHRCFRSDTGFFGGVYINA